LALVGVVWAESQKIPVQDLGNLQALGLVTITSGYQPQGIIQLKRIMPRLNLTVVHCRLYEQKVAIVQSIIFLGGIL